jgi:hypothetical protein
MLNHIDSFILNKDISSWYETLAEDYQDYFNISFGISIKITYIDNDFLISVHKSDIVIAAAYTYDFYSKKTDSDILDHILKMVWEIINKNH